MGSCSGSCTKPLPSPPPHYFTLVKGWSEGEGRVAGLEAAHAAELKEEYRITTLPPLPDRHPIHSLGGIFLLHPPHRFGCVVGVRDSIPAFLPTISPLAHAVMSSMPIPRGIHTAFWGFSPSFGVCARACSARRRREQLQRPPSANHVWEELL